MNLCFRKHYYRTFNFCLLANFSAITSCQARRPNEEFCKVLKQDCTGWTTILLSPKRHQRTEWLKKKEKERKFFSKSLKSLYCTSKKLKLSRMTNFIFVFICYFLFVTRNWVTDCCINCTVIISTVHGYWTDKYLFLSSLSLSLSVSLPVPLPQCKCVLHKNAFCAKINLSFACYQLVLSWPMSNL